MEPGVGAPEDRHPPIAAYGLIGDAHGAALVSRDGSIDWCCLPHIDSPAFFLRLLDISRGGFFRVSPVGDNLIIDRRYVEKTNVLETTFRTDTGALRLWDAFDVGERTDHQVGDQPARKHRILRLAECVEGDCEIHWTCRVTPDFARQPPVTEALGQQTVRWDWNGGVLTLGTSVPTTLDGAAARGRRQLQKGDRLAFILGDKGVGPVDAEAVAEQMGTVRQFWRAWADRCSYRGPYRQAVVRSALTLKLLTHEPSGAIVAAPTTSLPEEIGGERNWDYRYCWLRDATFTLHALQLIGYSDEAHDFMHWIQRVCMACGVNLQIMYGVNGERDLPEVALDHLDGYRGSRPVRIGNAAHRQQQLDVFGEVLDSAFLFFHRLHDADHYGETLSDIWSLLRSLVDHVAHHWREPDSGLWEMRGAPRHFLHSKLLCWVALDRGIRLAETHGCSAPLMRWRWERSRLRHLLLGRGYSRHVGAFTQSLGEDALDASALLMPLVGFIEAQDPRMLRTIEAIQEQLMEHGLVRRYRAADGLTGEEGTFAICTFWLVDCLALAGRVDEARSLFENMLKRGNDLGLYAEEIDPQSGEFLGNFPQGFTHIALIRSALFLEEKKRSDRAVASET